MTDLHVESEQGTPAMPGACEPFPRNGGVNVLLVLDLPQAVRRKYQAAVAAAYPAYNVRTVARHEADSFICDADILITFASHVTVEALRHANRLKWIQSLGTGVDGFGDHKALRPHVLLTNMRGLAAQAMSEAALMGMLALARELPRSVRNQDLRMWEPKSSRLLSGAVVGIAGVGAIASALAPRCKALGMTVVGFTSTPERMVSGFDRLKDLNGLQDTVGEVDFLVILTPYSKRTHGLINAPVLAAMKPNSFLVNLARGPVIDEPALLAALDGARLAGAALDVFVTEPLPTSHPLWSHDKVLVTPHQGGRHEGYDDKAIAIVVSNMALFAAGNVAGMPNVVHRPIAAPHGATTVR